MIDFETRMLESDTDCKIFPLNLNTAVVDTPTQSYSPEKAVSAAPEKIKRRIKINTLGLNGLATIIVPPELSDRLTTLDLKKIVGYSNSVNALIGLPESEDLIIRSATTPFFHPNNLNRSQKSEPAMLVKSLYDNPSYEYFGNGPVRPKSLESFLNTLGKRTFLLVHDDNYSMQTKALHGSIYQKGNNAEFYFRTGSLQAREFGNPNDGYPTLRINTNELEDLAKLNPMLAIRATVENRLIERSNISVRATSCQPQQAVDLTHKILQNTEIILSAYELVQKSFGEGSTMEMRIYQGVDGWIGQKLHVLDVDC